ncbi:chromosome-associated kinesin KIF4 [Trichonephila clavata]|uniref:Chromosome-associated kinesin KIF4 n=1 Tax=Trichonephila clavata TaxID=2740835 RepID=A0A8X6M4V6_TRICU|nr:chromosome-associated kinesin KIF4 [Trichonephila clavata]
MARQINISPSLRCRPLIAKERPSLYPINLRFNTVSIDRRMYNFHRVFDPRSKNEDIFRELVFEKIDDLIKGYNVAFMTYGPSKTGKSYTMGTFYNRQKEIKDPGIIPRTVTEIFRRIRNDEQYTIKISFVEMVDEEVYDLLVDPTVERVVKETDVRDIFEIEDLLEVPVKTANEALDVLAKGISARRGITRFAKKLRSPRAHLLYTLTLEVKRKNLPFRVSKVHFVEIGTAERVSAPEAHRQKRQGEKPLQALLTFNKIIINLSLHKKIVPYRESKLTSILKETLGGNCITVLIACVSNAYGKIDRSVEPIKISSTARKVVNKPVINVLNPAEQRRFIAREEANKERRQEAERNAHKRKNKQRATNLISKMEKLKIDRSEIDDPKTFLKLMKKEAIQIISKYEEQEREEARMKRSRRNEDEGGDDAVAGPSGSGDTTFTSIPEELETDSEDDDPHGYYETYEKRQLRR